jgi:hypothetical protein
VDVICVMLSVFDVLHRAPLASACKRSTAGFSALLRSQKITASKPISLLSITAVVCSDEEEQRFQ